MEFLPRRNRARQLRTDDRWVDAAGGIFGSETVPVRGGFFPKKAVPLKREQSAQIFAVFACCRRKKSGLKESR